MNAILLSGTAYNFQFSMSSIMENLVMPNNADVFILTSRYNMRRKSHSSSVLHADDPAWHEKAVNVIRHECQYSLLIHKLGLEVQPIDIFRSARFTNGGDGFDYMNYLLRK